MAMDGQNIALKRRGKDLERALNNFRERTDISQANKELIFDFIDN